MRKKRTIICGNWKMNTSLMEGIRLFTKILQQASPSALEKSSVIIFPPVTHLSSLGNAIGRYNISLGAQNCYTQNDGNFTGELSAPILASVYVKYVLVGHSERRVFFREPDALVAQKTSHVLENSLTPIVCFGENLLVREQGNYIDYVCKQLAACLFHLSANEIQELVIAYEPMWAIGTGEVAQISQIEEMHQVIRYHLAERYSKEVAHQIPLIYGGSVTPSSVSGILDCRDVEGVLVGRSSLDATSFAKIVHVAERLS